MIRLRSQKLLSGVSTLAVLAAFGAADPVLAAGQTITSAGNPNPPVVNTPTTLNNDFIDVQAGSTIQADAQGRSIFNSGTLATFLNVDNSVLNGSISNTGFIRGSGISIFNNSVIGGGIINTGTIATLLGGTAPEGISIDNSIVNGGIHNNGASALIRGQTDGILLTGTTVLNGGITNQGSIVGSGPNNADGIALQGANVVLNGGITNQAGATISALVNNTGRAINLQTYVAFVGDIDNSGTISSSGGTISQGVNMAGGVLAGSIINRSTGTISATGAVGTGVNISAGTLTGDIDNAGLISGTLRGVQNTGGTIAGKIVNKSTGTIRATGANGIAVNMTGGTVAQGLNNQGDILANGAGGVGVSVTGGTLNGGITTSGLVQANGAGGQAIVIDGVTFGGGLNNSGDVEGATTAILINNSTFGGGVSNGGSIQGGNTALLVSNSVFTGDIVNDGSITATNFDAVSLDTVSMTGDILNNGSMAGGRYGLSLNTVSLTGDIVNSTDATISGTTGLRLDTVSITGEITNDGTISGGTKGVVLSTVSVSGGFANTGTIQSANGITASAVLFSTVSIDSFTNDGTISGEDDGVTFQTVTVTNDFVNNADITGAASGTGVGVRLDTVAIGGVFNNTGSISGFTAALALTGGSIITGGIQNSGDITAFGTAVNLGGAGAAHTITQTGGSIAGGTALNLVNGFDDQVFINGGTIEGDVAGDGPATDERLQFGGSGTVAYVSGAASGLNHFDFSGSGTALLGADERGVDGLGVTVGAGATVHHMRVLSGASPRIYLDDNTTIELTNDFDLNFNTGSAPTLEYFLTTNTGTYGTITAATANLDGTIAAYLDPTTFATAALPTGVTLTYTGVIQSGGLTGTFDNVGNILVTSNPFFVGNVIYNGGNVDLTIQRLAFNNALIAVTQNQKAVGGALEQVYDNAILSPSMTNAFASLFNSATPAQVRAKMDELSGSQHAQLLQTSQSLTGMVNGLVEERLDGVLISQDGVRMSGTPGQRYAQAVAIASDASSSGLRGSQGLTRGESGMSAWLRGFGNWVNVDQDPEATGYQQDSNGLIGGVDFAINNNATVGGAVAYAQTDVDFNTPPDNADLDTWQLNLFGSYGFGRFYADGEASYGWHDVSAQRSIDLGPPAGSVLASSGYDASAWSASAELGAIWRLGRVNMQPSVGLAYVGADVDGFRETGPAYALNVSGSSSDSLASTLALRASGQWMMGKTQVVPDIKLGWRHEFDDERQSFTATFLEDATAPMSIISSAVQPDSLVLSTGATFGVTKNFEVFFDVNGLYNADASATNASGGVRVTW